VHLRSPSPTVGDCHRPLLEAIGHELMQRARAGDETILLKVNSHIGIHGNKMADKLAHEAADECCMGTMTYLMTTHNHSGTSTGCNKPSQSRQHRALGPQASRNQSLHKRSG